MNVASVALDGGDAALGMRNITVGEPLSNRVVFCPATVGTACDLDLSSGSCVVASWGALVSGLSDDLLKYLLLAASPAAPSAPD